VAYFGGGIAVLNVQTKKDTSGIAEIGAAALPGKCRGRPDLFAHMNICLHS